MSLGSDQHDLTVKEDDILEYLSLLSQSQGEKKINFSRSLGKIYGDHFTDCKNIGQAAFEDEEVLTEELHSLEQAIRGGQQLSISLNRLGKILEKNYSELNPG